MDTGATARVLNTDPTCAVSFCVPVRFPSVQRARDTPADSVRSEDTDTAPTVEDALSQASLLVNGGGLGDLQTVTEELNNVLGGREHAYAACLGDQEQAREEQHD